MKKVTDLKENECYQLTKSQLIEISENGSLVKELFPDVFEVELEVGKWYKRDKELIVWNGGEDTYGFTSEGYFSENMLCSIITYPVPATPEEVETAFKNYFIEKGVVNGVEVKCLDIEIVYIFDLEYKTKFDFDDNSFYMGGVCLFKDGKIAEIIQTQNDVIKVIETYGTDKLLTFIEAYNGKN